MKPIIISVPILLLALASSTAFAQDRTINGHSIPADMSSAVEERCAELHTLQGTTGTQTPETAVPESSEADATHTAQSDNAEGDLDISSITLEQCVEGGFTANN
ncbi:hypothetical protein [Devosia sp. MC1541]|uniref:hypothetical protein n=1 Tax=Devosia sp. MC1541 TaxID=2725264 RepID=UPI00145D3509|nr:hypothetical protein [Devosia sp. MC1541]